MILCRREIFPHNFNISLVFLTYNVDFNIGLIFLIYKFATLNNFCIFFFVLLVYKENLILCLIKRKVRLMRKLRLQEWNYFVTFTYSNELHTEETFRKKLSNTLKHLVARNGWKYVRVSTLWGTQ